MAKIRPLFISEDYNSAGQFVPPNPYGQEVSVGREMQGGDDQDMERDLQADIGAQPIKAIDEDIEDIDDVLKANNLSIDQFAQNIAKKLNYGTPQLLNSGTQGYAYDLGSKVILKITSDKTEATEALKLLGQDNKYIGDFYKVFNFDKPYDKIYVILREKLILDPDRVDDIYEAFYKYLNQYEITSAHIRNIVKFKDRGEYERLSSILKNLGTSNIPNRNDILQYGNVIMELYNKDIRSSDFGSDNFGFKSNGNLAYYDIGYSESKNAPQFDTLALENQIYERIISYMPGSKAMDVKKKCQLGGNGDGTSTACNQGDISNLVLNSIKEEVDGFHMGDAHEEIVNMDMDSALSEDRKKFTTLYHGTSHEGDENIKKRGVKIEKSYGGYFGWGFYTTPDLNLAKENYADFAEDNDELGVILEFKLSPNAIILDLDDPQDFETWKPYSKMIGDPNLWRTLIKNGIDGLYDTSFGGVVIYNPKVLTYVKDIEAKTIPYTPLKENLKKLIDEVMVNDFSYIPEGKDVKVEYGAVMLKFDIKNWSKITSMIEKDDIYDKPTFGIEKEPHVTVLYGFHSNVTTQEVKEIVKSVHDLSKPIEVELIKISIFEVDGQEYDVVKFDVKADELHEINKALKKLPHTSNFPDYHPHMTISYVKKGTGKKYVQKLKKSIKLQSKNLVYSTKDEKKARLNENREINVTALPFKNEIEQAGGKIYSVGGAVRDHILQRPSKDLDLLITGLPLDKLETMLSKYGKVDNVGKSFGIIKFNTPQTGELDIAIPRTERATGQGGYQGFEVTSDHELPIEKDLERRDFTINAIAKDAEGNLIDPYHGEEDIKNKVIRMVNPQAFKDDPLRMIRAVQFAARFGFTIEPETLKAIQDNASRIKEISPERILIEFDKIVKKGNPVIGAQLLEQTGLYQQIFDVDNKINYSEMSKVKSMGEFIFVLTSGAVSSPAEFFKDNLKGDIDTYNEIRAYELAYKQAKPHDVQTKLNIFGMNKLSPKSLDSDIIPHDVKENIDEMKKMGMPFSMKDLQINGNDLLALGYTGQQIGKLLKDLIVDIYSNKLRNNRDLLLRHLTPKIQEV